MVTIKASYDYCNSAVETFIVHKTFICSCSPYFAAAFKGPFKKGGTHILELDVHPDAFAVFVDWVYSQRIQNYGSEGTAILNLLELWLFADRVSLPKLQNEVLEIIEQERLKLKW